MYKVKVKRFPYCLFIFHDIVKSFKQVTYDKYLLRVVKMKTRSWTQLDSWASAFYKIVICCFFLKRLNNRIFKLVVVSHKIKSRQPASLPILEQSCWTSDQSLWLASCHAFLWIASVLGCSGRSSHWQLCSEHCQLPCRLKVQNRSWQISPSVGIPFLQVQVWPLRRKLHSSLVSY